jgi:hypothetical protein
MTDDKQPRTLTAEEVRTELLEDLYDQAELWTRAAAEIKRLAAALEAANALATPPRCRQEQV